MRDKMCNECKRCDGDLCTYFDNYSDRESTIACILFEPKKPTVFDYITQSKEKLAENFIYKILTEYDEYKWRGEIGSINWKSEEFDTRAEALIATIVELKKEVKDE